MSEKSEDFGDGVYDKEPLEQLLIEQDKDMQQTKEEQGELSDYLKQMFGNVPNIQNENPMLSFVTTGDAYSVEFGLPENVTEQVIENTINMVCMLQSSKMLPLIFDSFLRYGEQFQCTNQMTLMMHKIAGKILKNKNDGHDFLIPSESLFAGINNNGEQFPLH